MISTSKNKNIASTIITDTVRVSTASIFYESWFGDYFQYETLVFSKDPRVEFKQIIHGTSSDEGNMRLIDKSNKIHGYIANNLASLLTPAND